MAGNIKYRDIVGQYCVRGQRLVIRVDCMDRQWLVVSIGDDMETVSSCSRINHHPQSYACRMPSVPSLMITLYYCCSLTSFVGESAQLCCLLSQSGCKTAATCQRPGVRVRSCRQMRPTRNTRLTRLRLSTVLSKVRKYREWSCTVGKQWVYRAGWYSSRDAGWWMGESGIISHVSSAPLPIVQQLRIHQRRQHSCTQIDS